MSAPLWAKRMELAIQQLSATIERASLAVPAPEDSAFAAPVKRFKLAAKGFWFIVLLFSYFVLRTDNLPKWYSFFQSGLPLQLRRYWFLPTDRQQGTARRLPAEVGLRNQERSRKRYPCDNFAFNDHARLDFYTLVLVQPEANDSLCNRDQFIVTGGSRVPSICGMNTGQHSKWIKLNIVLWINLNWSFL